MKTGCIATIMCVIVLAALVSGCSGQGETSNNTTVHPPSGLSGADQMSWYEYNMTEMYNYGGYDQGSWRDGWANWYEPVKVKVGSVNGTWQGKPAVHKRINMTPHFYDVYVDSEGKILAGNYTTVYEGDARPISLPPGGDYAQGIGYIDIPARLEAEKNDTRELAGYEVVSYKGTLYNCTTYNMSAGENNYTIWCNASLPVPARIFAYPGGSEQGVQRIFELVGWGDNASMDIVIPTNPPKIEVTAIPLQTPTPTPIPVLPSEPISRPMPSMLFDMDGISRYQYVVAVPMSDMVRHQKLRVNYSYGTYNYSEKNVSYDRLARQVDIDSIWLGEDNQTSVRVFENIVDGDVLYGYSTGEVRNGVQVNGTAVPFETLHNYKKMDVSTRFDITTDSDLKLAGYENIRYKGDLYNCTVFDLSVEKDTFRIWHNTSLPLPPKIVADYRYPEQYFQYPGEYQVIGPCTYELMEWG